jgi:glycosyltransferase involved in cell wall biosynthesis
VSSQLTTGPSVAVAIPAYNEADGIGGFLREIDDALAPHVGELRLIVVDDASTDETRGVLEQVAPELSGTLEVVASPVNRGHGPTVVEAYRRALVAEPDFVLQVDGDGQFAGSDLRRALVLLLDEAHAVCGVRRFRQDPWFRMAMTRLLRGYVRWGFGVAARDANCPLRGYEAPLLAQLLDVLPDDCLIPNLYLTLIASRRHLALLEVDVSHRVRRGTGTQGTTWARTGRRGGRRGGWGRNHWRLVRFSLSAVHESAALRARLRAEAAAPVTAGSVPESQP